MEVDAVRDIAIVVFTRHGERPVDKDDPHLTPEGVVRAEYMNKCIDRAPTVALPLGAPTRMLASLRYDSFRPVETLQPIADKLGLPLETADMMDIYAVNEIVPSLRASSARAPGSPRQPATRPHGLAARVRVLTAESSTRARGARQSPTTSCSSRGSTGSCRA